MSDLHLAQHCEEPYTNYPKKSNHRLSLDITNMTLDLQNDAPMFRRHQRHMSDPEPLKLVPATTDKTNFGKFFGAFNGRKKVYKLSECPHLTSDITE